MPFILNNPLIECGEIFLKAKRDKSRVRFLDGRCISCFFCDVDEPHDDWPSSFLLSHLLKLFEFLSRWIDVEEIFQNIHDDHKDRHRHDTQNSNETKGFRNELQDLDLRAQIFTEFTRIIATRTITHVIAKYLSTTSTILASDVLTIINFRCTPLSRPIRWARTNHVRFRCTTATT